MSTQIYLRIMAVVIIVLACSVLYDAYELIVKCVEHYIK